jgi:hypothetical protein
LKLKPHVCDYEGCNAAFAQKGHLKRHKDSSHNGVLRFACTYEGCDVRCSTQQNLDRHVATHTGERPYACTRCDERFTQDVHRKSHEAAVHDRLRPFVCTHEACEASYERRERLVQHMLNMHTREGWQRQKKTENAMAMFFCANNVLYKREQKVDFKCVEVQDDKWARIDFTLDVVKGVLVLVENDEHAHSYIDTSCDVKRIAEIIESWALDGFTLPVVFIRFNPHAYRVNGALRKRALVERHETLLSILEDHDHPIYDASAPLKILHMYYDTRNGVPVVASDYGPLRDCIMPCVV